MDEQQYDNCSIRKRTGPSPHAIPDLLFQSALVVAANPNDGMIGAGALLARIPMAGIVTIADGVPLNGRLATAAGFQRSTRYRRTRSRESMAAMALLGRKLSPYLTLGIPDQRIIFKVESIARRLCRALRTGNFKYMITHPYEGIHSDYDATALAVHAARLLLEKDNFDAPILVEMASYKSMRDRVARDPFPAHDNAGPIETFFLSPAEQALKRSMFDCHETQRATLLNYPVDIEQFRLAPSYDFLVPPEGLKALDRYGWNSDEGSWCHAASRALYRLKLLDPT